MRLFMKSKLAFMIFTMFMLIVMSMGIVNAETIVGEPANGTDTYAVKYGSTVKFTDANSKVILESNTDNGISVSGNEIYVGGLGKFTATVGGKTYKFFSWNAHLKTGSSVTYKTKAQSFSSIAETLYADTYLAIEEVSDSKLNQITDYLFASGGSYKGDTLIGRYLPNYYDKSRDNQSKQNNYEYSKERNNDVILIGSESTDVNSENSEDNIDAVKYGSTIKFKGGNAVLTSSDNSIASVNGMDVQVIGVGRFEITAKSSKGEKTYKFFSWNSYLKAGQYWVYKDKSRSQKAEILHSKTYLALEKINNSTYIVNDYLFASGGSYKGTLKGKYLTSYYNESKPGSSTVRYYEYSMKKNDEVKEMDITSFADSQITDESSKPSTFLDIASKAIQLISDYDYKIGIEVLDDLKYVDGQIVRVPNAGKTVDSSSYVSLIIQLYGQMYNIPEFKNFYKDSSGFQNIANEITNGNISDYRKYMQVWANPNGLSSCYTIEQIHELLQPGDILVYRKDQGHIDIFAGWGSDSTSSKIINKYSCGFSPRAYVGYKRGEPQSTTYNMGKTGMAHGFWDITAIIRITDGTKPNLIVEQSDMEFPSYVKKGYTISKDTSVKFGEKYELPKLNEEQLKYMLDKWLSSRYSDKELQRIRNDVLNESTIKDIIKIQNNYNVSSIFMIAVATMETGIGSNNYPDVSKTYNLFNIRGTDANNVNGAKIYKSYKESFEDFAKTLAEVKYYYPSKNYTIYNIAKKYCSPELLKEWTSTIINLISDMMDYYEIGDSMTSGDISTQPSDVYVALNTKSITLKVGRSYILIANIIGNIDTAMIWKSADTNIAVVSPTGIVTGMKAGTTIVTVTVGSKTASCVVIVESNGKPVYNWPKSGKVLQQYSDETINVSIEKISSYYVTKIWVKDPASQIKKKEAGWGQKLTTVNSMLNNTNRAIVGCNGSGFYKKGSYSPSQSAIKKTNWDKTTEGYLVISDGVIRRQIPGQNCNTLLGILPNGSLKYYENNPYSDVINDGVQNTFTFGPMLIKDGNIYKQKGSPRQSYSSYAAKRTTIGQVDENNFVIITTAGSSKLNAMANFGVSLGCQTLYNLDGGGSTSLWFRNSLTGKGSQVKSSSRPVGDALYFISLKESL